MTNPEMFGWAVGTVMVAICIVGLQAVLYHRAEQDTKQRLANALLTLKRVQFQHKRLDNLVRLKHPPELLLMAIQQAVEDLRDIIEDGGESGQAPAKAKAKRSEAH